MVTVATLERVREHLDDEDPELVRAIDALRGDWEEGLFESSDPDEVSPWESFDIAIAVYWLGVLWHGGMASPLYKAQCATLYSPGMGETQPDINDPDCDNMVAARILADLEAVMLGGKD